jgi:hypothetical protein
MSRQPLPQDFSSFGPETVIHRPSTCHPSPKAEDPLLPSLVPLPLFFFLSFPLGICFTRIPAPRHLDRSEAQWRDPCIALALLRQFLKEIGIPSAARNLLPARNWSVLPD